MTPQETNEAIAVACGWRLDYGLRVDAIGSYAGKGPLTMKWIGPDGSYMHPWRDTKESADKRLPNYCGDLNAMREAELTITDDYLYDVTLQWICNDDWNLSGCRSKRNAIYATAAQRARAFLEIVRRSK